MDSGLPVVEGTIQYVSGTVVIGTLGLHAVAIASETTPSFKNLSMILPAKLVRFVNDWCGIWSKASYPLSAFCNDLPKFKGNGSRKPTKVLGQNCWM